MNSCKYFLFHLPSGFLKLDIFEKIKMSKNKKCKERYILVFFKKPF